MSSRQAVTAEALIGIALIAWGAAKLTSEMRPANWALVVAGIGLLTAVAFRLRAPANDRLQRVATLVTVTSLLLIGLDAAR